MIFLLNSISFSLKINAQKEKKNQILFRANTCSELDSSDQNRS